MIKFCSLFSGSSGNCIFVKTGKSRILIDAGLSGINVENALLSIDEKAADIDAIIVSHDHSDHTKGVGVLSRKYNIPIYANQGTWSVMSGFLGTIQSKNTCFFDVGEELEIGDVAILPFSVPHDASDPVGFNLFYNNKKITVATDIGHISPELTKQFEGTHLILLEANHDINMLKAGRYPYPLKLRILGDKGHLSNEAAACVVCEMAKKGVERFVLGHLSKENNYPALAYETANSALLENGIVAGKDVLLEIAKRSTAGSIVCI